MQNNTAENKQVELVAKSSAFQAHLIEPSKATMDESSAIAIDLAVHQAKLDGRWERMREERALQMQMSGRAYW